MPCCAALYAALYCIIIVHDELLDNEHAGVLFWEEGGELVKVVIACISMPMHTNTSIPYM